MAISATLGLWLTRGTTFFADELTYFVANRGFDLRALLSGHNGHLIAGTRLIYATVLKLFGSGYLPFRILEVLGVALVSRLFFILAKRRIGAAAALVPSVVLLFLGSSGEVTVTPLVITHVYSVATGLGALLALERRDRWGDVGAVRARNRLRGDVHDRSRLPRRNHRFGPAPRGSLATRLDLCHSDRPVLPVVCRRAGADRARVLQEQWRPALERAADPQLRGRRGGVRRRRALGALLLLQFAVRHDQLTVWERDRGRGAGGPHPRIATRTADRIPCGSPWQYRSGSGFRSP
jgi:hypothetical protein